MPTHASGGPRRGETGGAAGTAGGQGDEIYQACATSVHKYVAAHLDRTTTEDLATQVFIEAWTQRFLFDPQRGSVTTWVLGIASNVVRRYQRDEARRARAHGALAAQRRIDDMTDALQEDVVDAIVRADAAAALQEALAKISAEERQVLLMAVDSGLTYQELADRLGIPVGTVRSRLSRARHNLAVALGLSDASVRSF